MRVPSALVLVALLAGPAIAAPKASPSPTSLHGLALQLDKDNAKARAHIKQLDAKGKSLKARMKAMDAQAKQLHGKSDKLKLQIEAMRKKIDAAEKKARAKKAASPSPRP